MQSDDKPPTKKTTAPSEWIFVLILIILTVIISLVIIYVLKPKIFASQPVPVIPGQLPTEVTCQTLPGPSNLSASVQDFSTPSFKASWNPVLNQDVLGYNVYSKDSPGITISNSTLQGFSVTTTLKCKKNLTFDKTYYFRVQTVSKCGPGELSTEEIMITI